MVTPLRLLMHVMHRICTSKSSQEDSHSHPTINNNETRYEKEQDDNNCLSRIGNKTIILPLKMCICNNVVSGSADGS